MKKTFSENQIGTIKSIVKNELQSDRKQRVSAMKAFGWTIAGIACSFLVILFIPELLRKGASRIYKMRIHKNKEL